MKRPCFSIAANVCAADTAMIMHTVPSWLRVFNSKVEEVLLVVDERQPTGRILAQHKQPYTNQDLYAAIEELASLDSRVRLSVLDYNQVHQTSLRWFDEPNVVRCQAGTPIFAFLNAIERAKSDAILRIDCDMLFFDRGWVAKATQLIDSEVLDLVEPPKLGMDIHSYDQTISTRAVMLKRSAFFARCIPLKAYHLDWMRRTHRTLLGRPTWLSLEDMFTKEKDRKRIRHELLDSQLGFSIHVHIRDYANQPGFEKVVTMIESGLVPSIQTTKGWNLVLEFWPDLSTLESDYFVARV